MFVLKTIQTVRYKCWGKFWRNFTENNFVICHFWIMLLKFLGTKPHVPVYKKTLQMSINSSKALKSSCEFNSLSNTHFVILHIRFFVFERFVIICWGCLTKLVEPLLQTQILTLIQYLCNLIFQTYNRIYC